MKQKKSMYWIHCLIGIGIMFLMRFAVRPLPEITPIGGQVLGIFFGTLYLWTTVDPVWASILCVFMVGASDYASMGEVLNTAFGNPTVVQLLFLMILMSSIRINKLSIYIGRFFLTRKFAIGRPWAFTAALFVGAMLIAAFVDCFTPIFLFWPILYDIFDDIGMKKYEAYPSILLILIVVACVIGLPVPPYMSNGLALIANYATVSENVLGTSIVINNGQWLLTALIYGGFCCTVIILFTKYVIRPDVSKLKNLTPEQLNKNPLPPLNLKQKLVAVVCTAFLFSMLLPSVFPGLPGMTWLSDNSFGTALGFLVILLATHIDGAPVMRMESVMEGFAWGTFFLVAAAILLGGVLTNESTGIIAFLNTVLMPVFANISPAVFGVVLLVTACILTNICNSLVIGMILQPVVATYCAQAGIPSAPLITVMGIFVLSCAIATPAASPFAAMLFGNKEWLKAKDVYRYDIMYVILEIIIAVGVGLPLVNRIVH